MRTVIAIPCMDMIHTGFVRALAEMNKPEDTAVAYIQGTLIYEARNVIAANAVKDGFDRVLWLDSDMLIPANAMERLSAHLDQGMDMVSGLYFGRRVPFNPIILDKIHWKVRDDGNVEVDATSYLDYPKDSFFEIAGCGFGCVMTSTKLLREMVEDYGEPFTPLMGMGEDVTFCWRARQNGYRIFCDSTIKCGHIGHYPVTERDFERVHQSAP